MPANLLRSVCGTPLWNPKFIYDAQPEFTVCFQYTVLLWVPCFILWLITPLWVYMLTKNKQDTLRVSWLLICKTIITLLLIVLEIYALVQAIIHNEVYYVHYLTPSILIISYLLALALMHYERVRCLRSSGLLFVFWLSLFISSIIILRSHIIHFNDDAAVQDRTKFVLFILFFTGSLINTVLSCFMETSNLGNKDKKIYPENYANLLSKLTFWWINPIINLGYKRDITGDDLWKIENTESSDFLAKKLEDVWLPRAKEYMDKVSAVQNDKLITKNIEYAKNDENVVLNPDAHIKDVSDGIKKPSMVLCLFKVFGGRFLAGASFKLLQDILLFIGPAILGLLIDFISNPKQNEFMGYLYAVLLLTVSLIQTFALQHYFHRMSITAIRIRTSLMNMIFKKSLLLSTNSRNQTSAGQMMNLMTVDSQMFIMLMNYINMIWSAPLQIAVSLTLLWRYIGVSALIGFATMILFIPLNIFFATISKKLRVERFKFTDLRLKITNEILNGIKVIKLYGWELSFQSIISKIREDELKILRKGAFYASASGFVWTFAPIVVSMVSFATFVLIDKDNVLDPKTAFVCLTLFNILRFPLSMFPMVISSLIEANVSLNRITTFLLKSEYKKDDILHEPIEGTSILVNDAEFTWDNEKPFLKDLNFKVETGKLVAVVGSVGSGKSSLMSAILGDMNKLKGKVNVSGSIAYVPQQAWIQNTTLKTNIIFGNPESTEVYNQVIEACALKSDLSILPAGDATEIGEKGINLSGGQKARISLARAVYSNADLYLLDDPLSAVDAHVAKHIFTSVLGPSGILKDKTRLFVTNSLNFLPQTDEILMFSNGSIVEMGTYAELSGHENGAFANFIKSYLENEEKAKENQKLLEEQRKKLLDENVELPGKEIEPKHMHECQASQLTKSKSSLKAAAKTTNKKAGEKLMTTEQTASGTVKWSTIMEYIYACKWYLTLIFLSLYILSTVTSYLSSLWLSSWTNDMQQGESQSQLHYRLLVYVALGVGQCLFILFADWVFIFMFIKSSRTLHRDMLYSILRSTMQFFESTPIGRILNRFSKDIESVDGAIPDAYKMLMRCIMAVVLSVVIISVSTPWFLVSLVPIAVLYIFIQRYYVSSTRQIKRLEATSRSPIFSHFGEIQNGIVTIKAYGIEKRCIKQMENFVDSNLHYFYPNTVFARWLAIRLESIGTLISFFAALFAVIARYTGSITPGVAGLSISYSLTISGTLNWLVRQLSEFEASMTSIERINEYFDTPHEADWKKEEHQKIASEWPSEGNIKFVNYSVRYRDDLDYVLRNVCFNVNSNEKIGIVGRTGAGKSSLLLALFRILESNEGEILIDGVNIKSIGLHDLRMKIMIIPQDSFLFSDTLRMNLDPFEEYTDEQIWLALEKAHLKEFVLGLNKQLQFAISEGGENLSVGQRQLVCLARALLRKTKILILDEATASVDYNTDDLIQATIRKEFADCTILTIAHRINTIMDSSRIMVFDQGRLVEFDTPNALLANKDSKFNSIAKHASSNS